MNQTRQTLGSMKKYTNIQSRDLHLGNEILYSIYMRKNVWRHVHPRKLRWPTAPQEPTKTWAFTGHNLCSICGNLVTYIVMTISKRSVLNRGMHYKSYFIRGSHNCDQLNSTNILTTKTSILIEKLTLK